MDMPRRLTLHIGEAEAGKTVNILLRQNLKLSGTAVRRMKFIRGGITLDNVPVFTNVIAKEGQTLSVQISAPQPRGRIAPREGALCICYEDEDILVLDKPAPLAVHPGPGPSEEDTLANYLRHYYLTRGLTADVHPVNRLDRGTSGLMLVAKHPHAHQVMIKKLHTDAFVRGYLALCCGSPAQTRGCIDVPIALQEGSILRRCTHPSGQTARTHYETLWQSPDYSLVKLQLETGRTHQIRVHLESLGTPIFGDFLYGAEDARLPDRFALHAALLQFQHPITEEALSFVSPLPAALYAHLAEADRTALQRCIGDEYESTGTNHHPPASLVP